MNLKIKTLLLVSSFALLITACSEDEDPKPNPTPTPTPIVHGQINVYTNKTLGGQENINEGSFFATDSGKVYKSVQISTSVAMQSRIDLVFFYGSMNGSTIGAPSDSIVKVAHDGNTSLPNWSVKNTTLFSSQNISLTKFDSLSNDSILKTLDSASFSLTRVPTLMAGKVLAFKTTTGKIGMMHVVSTAGNMGINRTMTVNVKVQK